MHHRTYRQLLAELKASPCTSYSVLSMLDRLDLRDPLDALNDAQLLLDVQKLRCKEMGLIR